ncbi:MAG: hypothetical protein AAGU74_08100 [Bacillota bacterium]
MKTADRIDNGRRNCLNKAPMQATWFYAGNYLDYNGNFAKSNIARKRARTPVCFIHPLKRGCNNARIFNDNRTLSGFLFPEIRSLFLEQKSKKRINRMVYKTEVAPCLRSAERKQGAEDAGPASLASIQSQQAPL